MAVSDPGRKEVDRLLAQLEKRITKQYKQATKELETKLNNYLSSFAEKDKKKREQVKNGEITQKEYIEWRKGQILIGDRWKEMRDTMAKDLTNADKIAMNMVKDSLPDSYAISHNYATYEAEKGAMVDTSYTLYDRDTVKRLVKDNPDLLPAPKVDVPKDLRWNKTHLTDAITQGILQGEDIGKISRRLREVTDMDRNASIRNARTMTTSAENAGREDSYKRAEDMGIKMKQVWIATLDSRTRDAHRELDGQEIPVGGYFQNSVGKIRFPGDPQADPANVYNCRCTMIAKVDGSRIGEALKERQDKSIGSMSYKEWKEGKKKAKPASNEPKFSSQKIMSVMGEDNYNEFSERVNNAETKHLFDKYADTTTYKQFNNAGGYNKATDTIEYSLDKMEGVDKYSTFAHECGHMIDSKSADINDKLHFTETDAVGQIVHRSLSHRPSQSDEFMAAVRKDANDLRVKLRTGELVKELKATNEIENATGAVQDLLDGMYNTQDKGIFRWGHGSKYYNGFFNKNVTVWAGRDKEIKKLYESMGFDASNIQKAKNVSRIYDTASEAWANVTSAVTVGGAELDAIEKYMPETIKTYREIIEGIK